MFWLLLLNIDFSDTPTMDTSNCRCMALWIGLSSAVIIYNKHILVTFDFPFPVALTMLHMGFSSIMSHILVGLEVVDDIRMSSDMYFRAVIPIGCLYALILSLSNGTYMFLSVSFIQMIKAITPASVYVVGCFLGTESWSLRMAANLAVVVTGVTISAYGKLPSHCYIANVADDSLLQLFLIASYCWPCRGNSLCTCWGGSSAHCYCTRKLPAHNDTDASSEQGCQAQPHHDTLLHCTLLLCGVDPHLPVTGVPTTR
jgi:uncharacterized membrane protein (GlpM family)